MSAFLVAWTVCMTAACFVILAVVVGLEIRDHLAGHPSEVEPTLAPRIPAPRPPSAAVVVEVREAQTFDEFLRELILTPHVEEVLS